MKENKDKMGEMKKKFELAMDKLGKVKLEDIASHKCNAPSLSPEREMSDNLLDKKKMSGYKRVSALGSLGRDNDLGIKKNTTVS